MDPQNSIVSVASVDFIVTDSSDEEVVTAIADNDIVLRIAKESVRARTSDQCVVANLTKSDAGYGGPVLKVIVAAQSHKQNGFNFRCVKPLRQKSLLSYRYRIVELPNDGSVCIVGAADQDLPRRREEFYSGQQLTSLTLLIVEMRCCSRASCFAWRGERVAASRKR